MFFYYRTFARSCGFEGVWRLRKIAHSRQRTDDVNTSGVFCSLFAEYFFRNTTSMFFDTKNMQYHRMSIRRNMVDRANESAENNLLCKQCGEITCPKNDRHPDSWVSSNFIMFRFKKLRFHERIHYLQKNIYWETSNSFAHEKVKLHSTLPDLKSRTFES